MTAVVIRAELTGPDKCTALGLTVRGSAPVLKLCRALVEAGHDPRTPMVAYRGRTVCLRVRSIGAAARLEINAKGSGFIRPLAVRRASPVRFPEPAATYH